MLNPSLKSTETRDEFQLLAILYQDACQRRCYILLSLSQEQVAKTNMVSVIRIQVFSIKEGHVSKT